MYIVVVEDERGALISENRAPRSSSGASSVEVFRKRKPVSAMSVMTIIKVIGRYFSDPPTSFS